MILKAYFKVKVEKSLSPQGELAGEGIFVQFRIFRNITFSVDVNCLLIMDFFFKAQRCSLSFSFGFAELCLKDIFILEIKILFSALFVWRAFVSF